MRKILEHCPACGSGMIVTQQSCVSCDTAVTGPISAYYLCQVVARKPAIFRDFCEE